MNLNELKKRRIVLVTGPQRSGTTIMSRMLAHDLNWRRIDEVDFKNNSVDLWREFVYDGENLVIQCPTMLHLCDDLPEDVAAIVMIRPIKEIHASERRIGWDLASQRIEAEKFGKLFNPAKVKYEWIMNNDFDYIPHRYGSRYMKLHPLWRDNRRHFKPKQTA